MLGSLLGSAIGVAGSLFGADKERKRQKEFAQNAIQWKVQDSLNAGIHPLFGLGASTAQYSPTNIVGDSIARAGQDIGGAIDKMRTPPQRADAFTAKLQSLQLRRGELENMLLESQLTRAAQTPVPSPPSMSGDNAVIPGQGDTRAPLKVASIAVKPRADESQAQDWENEYGEWADAIGAARLARDADKPMTAAAQAWLATEWQKVLRNQPNDLFHILAKRGKPARAPNRADVWKRR